MPKTLPAEQATPAAERAWLVDHVIKPLMDFSLAQEKAKQAEGQRAAGVVAKVDAFNAATAPKRWTWPWARPPP